VTGLSGFYLRALGKNVYGEIAVMVEHLRSCIFRSLSTKERRLQVDGGHDVILVFNLSGKR
jgi:hypothetical protein